MKSLRWQTYGTQMKSGRLNLGLEVVLECVSRMQCVSASWGYVPAEERTRSPELVSFGCSYNGRNLHSSSVESENGGYPGPHVAWWGGWKKCLRERAPGHLLLLLHSQPVHIDLFYASDFHVNPGKRTTSFWAASTVR